MAYTSIDDPGIYFNTVLYTGNGSTNAITGVGFAPDWVWLKGRNNANNHNLNDTVRGVNKQLYSDLNNAETTATTHLTAFDSDGFTLGNDGAVNGNSDTYVSWNWLAGGSASSNGNGSITSSVSANTTAGFSIVTYTGNGTAGATVGHGLGSVPRWIIVKVRNTTNEWVVYHASLGATKFIELNSAGASQTSSTRFNDTEPTSSVFSLGTAAGLNTSSDTHVAYCFSEKKGYSKFSSYVGNGSSDGPFVYTGFRPSWVLFKKTTGSAANWQLWDNKRDPDNPVERAMHPDIANTPSTDQEIDFLSNGFKIRDTGHHVNGDGITFIYMALAESPFVNSNGVPNNAR
tara:strand:- start:30 stop:1064 length:1035 start_codon:yes stop_codon:yes gene_type:complete